MAEQKNELQQFNTKLSFYSNQYTGLMERDFEEHGIVFDEYSKKCVMSAMSSIHQLVTSSGEELKDINGSNLRQIIGQVASLKLNANAIPRECYFSLRTRKIGSNYIKEVELGVEGDGNDAILRQHGVNIKKVHSVWIVKEGDEFTYPKRKGLELTPPEWEEKGLSLKVTKVVYPVEMNDGRIEYLISERDSVKINLMAHIRNNMMNETFGILQGNNAKGKPKTRYDATKEEAEKIAEKKNEILSEVRNCKTVDEIIECKIARKYISAAWLDTPESMIVRKMRNNAIKKYPKDFNSIASRSMLEMDEVYQASQEEIQENANTVDFDVEDAETIEIDEPNFA